jgi:hypothetical protein
MAIEGVAEEVATNLEEIAEVTRRIDARGVGFVLGGFTIGLGVGFYLGRRLMREKLRVEAFTESQKEVEAIRETYQAKQKAMAAQDKPTTEEIIQERGYSTAATREHHERPLRAPVPVLDRDPLTRRLVEERIKEAQAEDARTMWNYPEELANRSPDAPYVIHQDEFKQGETGYVQTVYTYYAIDDVLADTDETPVPHADIVVGQDNLKWGHGTDDPDVVFVRNDKLELEMEICRIAKSYEEEVLGHDRNETN